MTVRLRSEDLQWKELDDEIVVLDSKEGTYLAINGSGAVLWPRLAAGATMPELVQALVDAYRLEEDVAKRDTQEFVASLGARGLLAS
jgi:hypothetical protein